jgi:hypothetical protein
MEEIMSKQAIVNLVILAITVIVAIGGFFGADLSGLDPDKIGVVVGGLITVISPIWLTWKNTPLTEPARKAQAVIKAGKQGYDSLSAEEKEALDNIYQMIKGNYEDDSEADGAEAEYVPADPGVEGSEGFKEA